MTRLIVLLGCAMSLYAEALPGGDGPGPGGAPGDPTGTGEGGGAGGGFGMLWILLAMIAFMYFAIIRPQKKEQKKRQNTIDSAKIGQRIVTIGGLHGEITRKGEKTVDIKVKSGAEIEINLGAINQVLEEGEEAEDTANK